MQDKNLDSIFLEPQFQESILRTESKLNSRSSVQQQQCEDHNAIPGGGRGLSSSIMGYGSLRYGSYFHPESFVLCSYF